MQQTVEGLIQAIESRQITQVITANPIMIMTALEQPKYMAMMQRAELIVPDGAGLVWALSYVGKPVAGKVAGIDLMHELFALAEVKGWRIFLLGTSPEIIQVTAGKLRERYPKLQLVGVRDGYFQENEDETIINQIREAAPDILLVGRSADKQEPWIDRYKEQLGVPIIMGIGGSFDVLSGKLKRAPKLFIRLRLEWFYRLMQEPWRYKRMLLLPKFVVKVIRDKGKLRL
ncbi:glycosyltransferase [Paenibacillus psychroresistens]|uniref:Glycosyltransferase n=1 Tax=Paenibacillus psychroresistens TaxID=1778678 RepID=A0A6B8RTP7_9BACL|nr:WecB/TagA/CpsF family glycosyltransferase [Paenibacillus psychroresistens]QGQ99900.1 glycosyltransferase [Paenibacillus psychroresistens]